MLNKIDQLLNAITMYKLLLWGLRILTAVALVFSLTGVIHLSFRGMVLSLLALLVSCYASNWILAKIWKVPANTESYVLTALILFLILPPVTTWSRVGLVFLAGVIAMASKFMIAYRGKHLFNPAAFPAAVLGLLGLMGAIWWIGNSAMWPLVLVLGLLVVRKIRRFAMVLVFAGVYLVVTALTAFAQTRPVGHELVQVITSSPLLFLGTIMLTEPATMPSRQNDRIIFGGIVGVLAATGITLGPVSITPEVALLISNLYAFIVSPKYRLRLTLDRIDRVSDRVANFVFKPDMQPAFAPGQYMEWTLPFGHHDSRGNRRTLSIASSPTEKDIQIGVKFYDPSSRFKQTLDAMKPGDVAYAGMLAGDFTLPPDPSQKLVFIAGGIGITPFRSMLKYLVDKGEKRDITVIYAVSDPDEIAYADVLKAAHDKLGIRIIPLLSTDSPPKGWQGKAGRITADFIQAHVADYTERKFYISGPERMVQSATAVLHKLGVQGIKKDHFSGY